MNKNLLNLKIILEKTIDLERVENENEFFIWPECSDELLLLY